MDSCISFEPKMHKFGGSWLVLNEDLLVILYIRNKDRIINYYLKWNEGSYNFFLYIEYTYIS